MIKKDIFFKEGNIHFAEFYDDENQLKKINEYYFTGELKSIFNLKNSKRISSIHYDKKGVKISEIFYNGDKVRENQYHNDKVDKWIGTIDSKYRKKGWWKMIDNNGVVIQKNQFLTINRKEYINQRIRYNSKGEIDYKNSYFFNVILPDTLSVGRSTGSVEYYPFFNKNSTVFVCIGYNLKSDYSNLREVRIDTFLSKNKNDKWFGLEFETSGKKIVRGFVYEQNIKINNPNKKGDPNDFTLKECNVYFEKEVYVKE